ncbi:MAG: hypothetical protein ACTSRH_02665 [Promethearchaeota archaeon]
MEDEEILNKEELELFYEVFFKRIMDIMKKPTIDSDPFGEMIKILTKLSSIFSFKSMISLIPELIASAIRYGMMVEKAYNEDKIELEEDIQGMEDEEIAESKRMTRIKEDIDKLSLYL